MTGRADSDRARFEALYEATRHDVLRYLARRSSDAEHAADALAETYLVAWEKLQVIPEGERARLWLFGVARNVNLQAVRRRCVADALVDRLAGELRTSLATTSLDEDGHHPVHVALRSLSERDREILTLTAWEGLAPREIAHVLGISANAVRIRLHRARSHVKERLATDGPAPSWLDRLRGLGEDAA